MNIEELSDMIDQTDMVIDYILHFEGDDYGIQCDANEVEFGKFEDHVYFRAMKAAEFTKFLKETKTLIANAQRLADAASNFLTLFNDGAIQLYEVDEEAEGCFDELEKATKDAIGKTCRCGRVHFPTVVNCLWCNDQTPWAKEVK